MNRSIFAKVAAAKATSKGDYIKGGRGQAVVLMCQGKETGELNVPTFIAEVKILTSEAKPGQMSEGAPAPAPAPGSVCGWVQKFDKKPAENATKAFILNLLGFQESEVSVEEFVQTMEQLVAKEQPSRGMLINFDTYEHVTKDKRKMTLVKWGHVVEGNEKEAVAARRAELDKTNPIQG